VAHGRNECNAPAVDKMSESERYLKRKQHFAEDVVTGEFGCFVPLPHLFAAIIPNLKNSSVWPRVSGHSYMHSLSGVSFCTLKASSSKRQE
jgi:hypothetical protein